MRANKSFLKLIGTSSQAFWRHRDAPALYEYLSEDSLINYWERYVGVCFDDSQKAVLTRAFLKNASSYADGADIQASAVTHVPCLFSFTIRRDPYKLARLIIGQFIPISPT